MMNPASTLRIPILEVPASSTAFRRAILGESQGSSSPLTPNTSAHSATRARFDEFFRVRDDEKAKMYKRVVFLCWFLGVIHALIIVAGLVLMYTSKAGDPLFTFFGVAFCYGNIGASTCLSVVVTVPVKEFDLDERLQQNPRIRRALFIALGLMSLLLGFLFITSFPYAPGIPLLLLGPRMLVDENLSVERRLLPTTKLFLLLLLTSLPIISLSAVAGLSPSSLTANFVLPGLWLDWAEKLIRSQPTSLYIYVASSAAYAISFFAVSVAWLRFARRGAAADAGWRTLMVYAALFCWTVVTGLVSIMQCIPVLLLGWDTMTKEAVPYYLACCASVLLPPLVALVVGPRKVFTLVARSFEYDLNRQKKDGALMAELAAASMFVDTVSNTRWVYRVKKSGLPFSTDRHQVQRQFWALGRIVRFTANGDDATLHLRVSMREDMDPTWTAHFSGTTAVFAGGSDGVVPVYSDEEFAQWVEANFSPAAVEETSAVNQSVTLIAKLTGRASNRDSLETWATGNLRLLEWRNFVCRPPLPPPPAPPFVFPPLTPPPLPSSREERRPSFQKPPAAKQRRRAGGALCALSKRARDAQQR